MEKKQSNIEKVISEVTDQCEKINMNTENIVKNENQEDAVNSMMRKLEEPFAVIQLMQVR